MCSAEYVHMGSIVPTRLPFSIEYVTAIHDTTDGKLQLEYRALNRIAVLSVGGFRYNVWRIFPVNYAV